MHKALSTILCLFLICICLISIAEETVELIYDQFSRPCENPTTESMICILQNGSTYTLNPGETLIRWPSGDLLIIPNQFAYGYVKNRIKWNPITDPNSKHLPDHFKGICGQNLCFATAASIAWSLKTGSSFDQFWSGVRSMEENSCPTSLMNKQRNLLLTDSPIANYLRLCDFLVESSSLQNSNFDQINRNIKNGTCYIATKKSGGHAIAIARVYEENNQQKLDYIDAQLQADQPVPATIRTDQLERFNDLIVAITP